jgi:hypothetical protein
MKGLDNQIGPVKRKIRKSWQTLLDTHRFQIVAFSIDWFEDLKRKLPDAEKNMNANRDIYLEWLRQRNCQHNVSNLFRLLPVCGLDGKARFGAARSQFGEHKGMER